MNTTRTKTFDLNTFRIAGKPKKFWDNTKKGGWDVTIVLEDADGQEFKIKVPAKKKGGEFELYFSEQQFMQCNWVSIIDGTFSSWTSKKSNRPVFELKSGGARSVLLGTNIGTNNAFIGGVVSAISEQNRRVMVDISYKAGLGKDAPVKQRSVVVNLQEGHELPSPGEEVIVEGRLHVNENKIPGILATSITVV